MRLSRKSIAYLHSTALYYYVRNCEECYSRVCAQLPTAGLLEGRIYKHANQYTDQNYLLAQIVCCKISSRTSPVLMLWHRSKMSITRNRVASHFLRKDMLPSTARPFCELYPTAEMNKFDFTIIRVNPSNTYY